MVAQPIPQLPQECSPRFATPRTLSRRTYGTEVADVARKLGWELMPHQRQALEVGLEVDDAGRFAYRDITITEPRQGGKSSRLFSLAVWRAVMFGPREGQQLITYSAQSGFDARRKMLDDWAPLLIHSELGEHVHAFRRGAGHEVIEFIEHGSRIQPMANTVGSGHGKVLDLALLDEAFDDVDDRREQAVIPAMATRKNAQLWVSSTAGTSEALYFKRKVEHGRKHVEDGDLEGSAYFEWSAPDDIDLDDEATWPSFMPALGRTIGIEAVRHAHRTMSDSEFARAFGNRWVAVEDRIIPWADWLACRDPNASPCGGLHLAVDAPPDRSGACIVVADTDKVLEVIEQRDGLAWVTDRLAHLAQEHDVRSIVVHGGGPVGTLVAELERNFPHLLHVATDHEMTLSAGTFFDAVVEHRVHVRVTPLSPQLDEAVAGARKRIRQDAFTWARRSPSADLSPLVAASLALWKASTDEGGALWLFG